jgi:hypothetical protein
METLTGYKLGVKVNKVLEEKGLATIPSTQIYRYFSQGLIPTTVVEGKTLVTEADAEAWIAKYVARRLEKAAKAAVVEETASEVPEAVAV